MFKAPNENWKVEVYRVDRAGRSFVLRLARFDAQRHPDRATEAAAGAEDKLDAVLCLDGGAALL